MVNSQLLRYKDNQRYLFLDVETENLNLFYNRPWQISYGLASNKKVDFLKTKYILWNDLNVSDDAARITRFNKNDYLKKAEDPMGVAKDLYKYIGDKDIYICGQNILGFDLYLINSLFYFCGINNDWSFINRVFDTSCLFKAYKKGIKPEKNLIAWQYKLHNFREKGLKSNLEVIARDLDIPFDACKAHDALYDTNRTIAAFQKLLWKVEI